MLLKKLEKDPTLDNRAMAMSLYGDPRSKAFIMLKSRLLDKMLELLSLSATLQNQADLKDDPLAFSEIHLHKLLSHALLLKQRGLISHAEELLRRCAKEAESASAPHLRLQALLYLRQLGTGREEGFDILNGDIFQLRQQWESDMKGREWMDRVRLRQFYQFVDASDHPSFLKSGIKELESQLEHSYNLRTHLDYLVLRISYFTAIHADQQAREVLEELKELIHTHASLGEKKNLGLPYVHLAEIEIQACQYQAAISAAQAACALYSPRQGEFLLASIVLMYACLLGGDLTQSEAAFGSLDWQLEDSPDPVLKEVIYYLRGCQLYMEGNTKEALAEMGQMKELLKHKYGWNSALRIQEMLLLLELGHTDTVIAKIEAFRKHLAKYPGTKREEITYRYLALLDRQSFDYHTQSPEMKALLGELKEIPWKPMGAELIRFDVWIQAKAARRSYYPLLLDILESHPHNIHSSSSTTNLS